MKYLGILNMTWSPPFVRWAILTTLLACAVPAHGRTINIDLYRNSGDDNQTRLELGEVAGVVPVVGKRLISARGQLESAWPVNGSVMVHEGVAYFAAGRQTFIDGGIVLYGLHPLTGEVLHRRQVSGPYDEHGFPRMRQLSGIPQIEGFKSGIFSAEKGLLYIRHQAFRPDLTRVAMEDLSPVRRVGVSGPHASKMAGRSPPEIFPRHRCGTAWQPPGEPASSP